MKIFFIILMFLVQPTFWIGLIRSFLNYSQRLKRTRRDFNISIYDHDYEMNHFLIFTLFLGILISLVAWSLEITLPFTWVMFYELLVSISLIILPGIVLPITILVLVSVGMLINHGIGGADPDVSTQNYALLAGITLVALGLFVLINGGRFKIPRSGRNQRGNLIAGYQFKELTVIPILIMIPAPSIQQWIPFYPAFEIGHHAMSLFLLPVLVGLRFTIFRHLARRVFRRLGSMLLILGVIGVVAALFLPVKSLIEVIVLLSTLGLTGLLLIMTKHQDLHQGHWIDQTVNGVRVIGIEPHTPADRLNLNVGDVILDVNKQSVHNEDEFYRALQSKPTYCRLRVLNLNDRLKLTGTAIFSGSPHELGVVLFRRN